MKKSRFIGKHVDLIAARREGWEERDDDDDNSSQTVLESPLLPTKHPEILYSVVLQLKDGRICNLTRVEHCHLCGGQGTDSDVDRLPAGVERALEREIDKVLCARSIAKAQIAALAEEDASREQARSNSARTEALSPLQNAARKQPETAIGMLRTGIILGNKDTADLVAQCNRQGISKEEILHSSSWGLRPLDGYG